MTAYANIAYDRAILIKVPAGYFPEAPGAQAWGEDIEDGRISWFEGSGPPRGRRQLERRQLERRQLEQ